MTPLRHAEQKQAGNLDGQQSAPFHFECPLTVFKADSAPEGKKRRIAGIISTDSADRQNERILQDGLSFDDFIQHGWFNDNHSAATTDILGYPESVKQFDVGDTLPDGSTASAKGTWVEGYLLDTKKANDIWELAQSLAKTHRRLGYSVEGAIESRSGPDESTIAKAKVRNVAITNCFPGDVRVSAAARGISRRIYNCPMVDLELTSGHKISGTPNHPVLTQRGWVPLGEVDHVSDRIGRALGKPGETRWVGQDIEDMPPRLDEIYNSAQNSGCIHYVREGSEGDFHGDGSNGDVDIISATGLLRGTDETSFGEHFRQLLLACPDARHLGLAAQGAPHMFPIADDSAATSVLGGERISLSLLDRACAVFASVLGDDVSSDASVADKLVHPLTRDAEASGEAFPPFASRISTYYFRLLSRSQRFFDSVCENIFRAKEFAHSDVAGSTLCGDGIGALPFLVHPGPASSVVSLFGRKTGPDDASLFADVKNARLADACGSGDIGGAFAGSIQFENVVSHGIRNFSGHVYNLDSVPGWYVANGIAHRNCPVNTDSRLEILARSLDAQNLLLARSMTLADSTGHAGPAKPNKAYTGQGAGQVLSRESFGNKPKKKRKSATLTRSEAVAYVQAQVPGCSEALARAIVLRTIQSNHP